MFIREIFQGMRPRLQPLLLQRGQAEFARDCDFRAGSLRPLSRNKVLRLLNSTSRSVIPCGNTTEGEQAFLEVAEANTPYVVRRGRTHYLQGGKLYYAPHEGQANPIKKYLQVLPRPTEALALTDIGSLVPTDLSYTLAYTLYNSATGDESGLSPQVTERLPLTDTQVKVQLSQTKVQGLLTALAGDYDRENIKVRIYMSSTGDFLQLADLTLPETAAPREYILDMSDYPRGRKFPWPVADVAPPEGLTALVNHPNGFMVLAKGSQLFFGDPLNNGMFPQVSPYLLDMPEQVAALEEHLNRIMVFFQGRAHQLIEVAVPSANMAVRSPEDAPPCLSGASVCKTERGIVYAAREGPVLTNGYESEYLLPQHFDRRSFAAYSPNSVRIHGDRSDLIVCNSSGSKTFLIQDGSQMTMLSDQVISAISANGALYMVVRRGLDYYLEEAFADQQRVRSYEWLSDPKQAQQPLVMNHARVTANYRAEPTTQDIAGLGLFEISFTALGDYIESRVTLNAPETVNLEIIQDGQKVVIEGIASSMIRPVATRGQANRWQVRLSGNAEVEQVVVGSYGFTTTAPIPGGQGNV